MKAWWKSDPKKSDLESHPAGAAVKEIMRGGPELIKIANYFKRLSEAPDNLSARLYAIADYDAGNLTNEQWIEIANLTIAIGNCEIDLTKAHPFDEHA